MGLAGWASGWSPSLRSGRSSKSLGKPALLLAFQSWCALLRSCILRGNIQLIFPKRFLSSQPAHLRSWRLLAMGLRVVKKTHQVYISRALEDEHIVLTFHWPSMSKQTRTHTWNAHSIECARGSGHREGCQQNPLLALPRLIFLQKVTILSR